MKKIILTLIAVLMLGGIFTTTSMAAEPSTEANVIKAKGWYDTVGLTLTYDAKSLKFNAVSSGIPIHIYFKDNAYLTFYYFNANDTLRYKEVVNGNQNCDKLAAAINSQSTVLPGDYIKIVHAEQYGRLSISGSVTNVDFDLSNGVKTLDVGAGYLYFGSSNMEFTTILKSGLMTQLNTALEAALQLKQEDYRLDTWKPMQSAITNAIYASNGFFMTQAKIQSVIDRLAAAQAGLRAPNTIRLLGVFSYEVLNVSIDYETMQLRATGSSKAVHEGFYSDEYYNIIIKDADGKILFSQGVKGVESSVAIAAALNGFKMEEGYSLYIGHKESLDRMQVTGPIVDAPFDFSKGMRMLTYGTDIHFQLVKGDLVYRAN